MQEHKITKEDGTHIKWTATNNSNYFCLLYSDNKQKFKFTPNENLNCELFMIGGGGAGGYFFGGGGGAGASYINNNYTFNKNKTYTFEIGNGGMCDIADINKLFKSGLILNIYNNTNVNLLNINFTNDDYSSLGIQTSGMIKSFNVNNITIPSSIFHNNTTYIWDGYIKTNSTGYFNVNINAKIKTIIWVDKFVYNNSNALIEGNNINDVKIIQLESNRFYNIKIIAYNDNNNSNNFNISFDGCQLFNFDKNEETYVYEPATDTSLTYRNDDNTFETIRCKGGGNGGCGFFNKNTNLDGGCGGGSGINKIKGSSIIGAIYNGYDGAVGDYCGGGGGIMSAGKNNMGGDGKIINWFNETLIFGAGGNAAKLSETRNLGYGCGGNGGECCYYSKLLINNNGNNGCILIYVKSSETLTAPSRPRITEGFAGKTDIMLPDTSIAKKLIENSFKISKYNKYNSTLVHTRPEFLAQTKDEMAYVTLVDKYDVATFKRGNRNPISYFDKYKNQTFIYDMLIISKLYAIIYRLYWHKFTKDFQGDLKKWENFCNYAKINLTNTSGQDKTYISNYDIYINNLFTIDNLSLSTNVNLTAGHKAYNNTIYGGNSITSIGMQSTVINDYCNDHDIIQNIHNVPLYHKTDGSVLNYLNIFNTAENYKYYKINIIARSATHNDIAPDGTTQSGLLDIKLSNTANIITKDDLSTYDTSIINNINNSNDYLITRIGIYLEALNIILNTDYKIILPILKYNMHYYNLVIYNINIQYGLVKLENERVSTLAPSSINTNVCYLPATDGTASLVDSATDYRGKAEFTISSQVAATIIIGTKLIIEVTNNSITAFNMKKADTSEISLVSEWKIGIFLETPILASDDSSAPSLTIKDANKNENLYTSTHINSFTGATPGIYTYTIELPNPQEAISGEKGKIVIDDRGEITNVIDINRSIAEKYLSIPTFTLDAPNDSGKTMVLKSNKLNEFKSTPNTLDLYTFAGSQFSSKKIFKTSCASGNIFAANIYTDDIVNNPAASVSNSLNTDLAIIMNNMKIITDDLIVSDSFIKVTNDIAETSNKNTNTSTNFYKNQQDLNKTINEYNSELEIYNNISFYYKLVVAFAILLTIIIIFIFTTKTIDNNSKISVYAIIVVMIIIAFILYKQYSRVKESFTIVPVKSAVNGINSITIINEANSINTYKIAVEKYINKLLLYVTNSNIGDNLNSSLTYIKKLSVVKNEKAELYKIKKINLMNSIEILKKNTNFYYYMIIAIFFSIIILNIGLILYLLNSAMIMQIVILCAVLFIILTYYISYYIHKSTRLAENKNYWANYNPSSTTFNNL
jgi:hypothetical protein